MDRGPWQRLRQGSWRCILLPTLPVGSALCRSLRPAPKHVRTAHTRTFVTRGANVYQAPYYSVSRPPWHSSAPPSLSAPPLCLLPSSPKSCMTDVRGQIFRHRHTPARRLLCRTVPGPPRRTRRLACRARRLSSCLRTTIITKAQRHGEEMSAFRAKRSAC